MSDKSETFDWDNIKVFLTIAELGSFGKAATQAGLTQPTISRRIEQLESQIGAKLFNRTASGTTLTQAGEDLLDSAKRMGDSAAAIKKKFSPPDQLAQGKIKIRVPDVLASCVVIPGLKQLLHDHPDLSVIIDCNTTELDDRSPDLFVSFHDPADQDLIRSPLCWVHYSFFASAEYLQEHGSPNSLAECATRRIMHHTAYYKYRLNWARKTSAIDVLIEDNHMVICDSGPLNVQAIQSGLGIGALPTIINESKLGLLPLNLGSAGKGRLHLYQQEYNEATAAISICSQWLRDIFSPKRHQWFSEEFVDPFDNSRTNLIQK